MNILYVFGGERAQGAEIVIERLMYLHAANYQVHLVLSPGKFADDLSAAGKPYRITTLNSLKKLHRSSTSRLRYIAAAIRNYLLIPVKLHRYIRRNKINIVHANTIVPASYLTLLILYSRIFLPEVKWIWSDHDMRNFSRLERHLSGLCARIYDRTLLVSQALAAKYSRLNPKIGVLYNGLDADVFQPSAAQRAIFRAALDIKKTTVLIGMAAVIHEDKGQLGLIQAFEQISARYPDTQLVIAGDYAIQSTEYGSKVAQAIQNNGDIVYLGYANPITSFYNGCDIVINNSNNYRSESLGTSIYEAMACEKIVVAAKTGGTPEIITDQIDGFLFEPESIYDLAAKLSHVLENFKELDQVRTAARQKVIRKFHLKTMAKNYSDIITNV